jgi:hypothetical protein
MIAPRQASLAIVAQLVPKFPKYGKVSQNITVAFVRLIPLCV